jgi:hypothetical protein
MHQHRSFIARQANYDLGIGMSEVEKKVNLIEPVNVDSIAIKRDHYFSNAYVIDFPLDSTPDHVWQDILEREWKMSRHLWDRKLFVIGNKLRLVTPASEIEDKLNWVRQVLERTNRAIDLYNEESAARRLELKEKMEKQIVDEEKAGVDTIKEIMRKRFG